MGDTEIGGEEGVCVAPPGVVGASVHVCACGDIVFEMDAVARLPSCSSPSATSSAPFPAQQALEMLSRVTVIKVDGHSMDVPPYRPEVQTNQFLKASSSMTGDVANSKIPELAEMCTAIRSLRTDRHLSVGILGHHVLLTLNPISLGHLCAEWRPEHSYRRRRQRGSCLCTPWPLTGLGLQRVLRHSILSRHREMRQEADDEDGGAPGARRRWHGAKAWDDDGDDDVFYSCEDSCYVCEVLACMGKSQRREAQEHTYVRLAPCGGGFLQLFVDFLRALEWEYGAAPLVCPVAGAEEEEGGGEGLLRYHLRPKAYTPCTVMTRPVVYLVGAQGWLGDDRDILRSLIRAGVAIAEVRVTFESCADFAVVSEVMSRMSLSAHASLVEECAAVRADVPRKGRGWKGAEDEQIVRTP